MLEPLGAIGLPVGALNGVAGGVVGLLSEVFAFEDLKAAFISDLNLKLQVKQGAANYDLKARGHLIGFDSTGQFRLAPNWRESSLQQSIDLLLVGRLAKLMKLTGGLLLDDNQYYPILKNGKLVGTLKQPELVDKLEFLQKLKLGGYRVLGEPARMIDSLLHLQNPVPDAINPFNLLKYLFPSEEDED